MAILAGIWRAVARAVIPKMFTQGFSATAAMKYFRGIGGKIRTKRWYADWREITGMKKLERTYRFIPRKIRLSFGMMAKTESYQQYEFKYTMDVHGRDLTTDVPEIRTMSYGSDTRYSIEEIEDRFNELLETETTSVGPEYGFEGFRSELMVVTRKGPAISEEERQRWYGL